MEIYGFRKTPAYVGLYLPNSSLHLFNRSAHSAFSIHTSLNQLGEVHAGMAIEQAGQLFVV